MIWILRLLAIATHFVVSLCLSIVGVPVIAWLAARRAWAPAWSMATGAIVIEWAPAWAWIWGNSEDGVIPPNFVNGSLYLAGYGEAWRAFVWCAIRNKVSNLRFTPRLGFRVCPALIRSRGNNRNLYVPLPPGTRTVQWSLTWQGIYSGLWVVWPGVIQVRIGWTIIPADADGFDPKNLRQRFCGYSFQVQVRP